MPVTPTAAIEPGGDCADAAASAEPTARKTASGAVSTPEPVTSHSSGALPLATSRPAAVHTVTLHEVVPTSTPTSSAWGISNLP